MIGLLGRLWEGALSYLELRPRPRTPYVLTLPCWCHDTQSESSLALEALSDGLEIRGPGGQSLYVEPSADGLRIVVDSPADDDTWGYVEIGREGVRLVGWRGEGPGPAAG